MRRKTTYPYLLIFLILLGLMSIPKEASERFQGVTIAAFSPLFVKITNAKLSWTIFSGWGKTSENLQEDILQLKLENQMLKNDLLTFKNILQHNVQASQKIQKLFSPQQRAIPAKVIFRSPASWNSSLWINVGERDNEEQMEPIVTKNSPVLVGTSVVGVIDYVGKHQSRVRLITDSGLVPSVRALRGDVDLLLIEENVSRLVEILKTRNGELDDLQNKLKVILEEMQQEIKGKNQFWFLAKGELRGNSKPLWRTNSHVLQGIGFNYDFPDKEGPARDLHSGKPLDANHDLPAMSIIQVHDLLVTTGMDGVFPPNLPVAEVISIKSLKEGDYFYELEAKPTAGNLDELSLVLVIPPSEYDEKDLPPVIGKN